MYHAIILPFFSYGCIVWSNTYDHNIKPLQIIQRQAIRLITFSNFDAHTSPLFAKLNFLKLQDHIKLQTLFFMHQFNTGKLPTIFDSFFVKTSCKHNVNTCFAFRSTFYLPEIRTNYGKFNIRFNGPKLWMVYIYLFCSILYIYFCTKFMIFICTNVFVVPLSWLSHSV